MILKNANNVQLGSSQVSVIYKQGSVVWSLYSPANLIATWLATISNIGGVTPSSTVQTAALNLLTTLNANGVLPKIIRMNLFCGGDWKASFVPLVATVGQPYDYNGKYAPNSSTQGPFGTSDWSLAQGFSAASNNNLSVGGNGTSNTSANVAKIIDTTVPENYFTNTNYSCHFSCYTSGPSPNNTLRNITDMGASAPFNGINQNFVFQTAYTGNSAQYSLWNCFTQDTSSTAGGLLPGPMVRPMGFFVGSRLSQNYSALYRDTGIVGVAANNNNPDTNTATPISVGTSTICVFGRGGSGSYGVNKGVTNLCDRSMYMYSIGTGLTQSDVIVFQNAITTFNTAIGRTNYVGYGYGGIPSSGITFRQPVNANLSGFYGDVVGTNIVVGMLFSYGINPISFTVTGTVDDDVTFNGVVYQKNQFPYNGGANGTHDFSYTSTLQPGQTITIGAVNNYCCGYGLNCTIYSTDPNGSSLNFIYTG